MATRFPVTIDEQGRLCPKHPERFLRHRGRERWVSLHEQPAICQRSDAANRYLWKVVYGSIALETGNSVDDIHYGLKREALRRGILEPEYITLGDLLIEAKPTTRTDVDTFSRYVDWIRGEAAGGRLTGSTLEIPEAEGAQ